MASRRRRSTRTSVCGPLEVLVLGESDASHEVMSVNTAATPWLGSRSSISRGMLAMHGERSTEWLANAQPLLACRHDVAGPFGGSERLKSLGLVAVEDRRAGPVGTLNGLDEGAGEGNEDDTDNCVGN